MSIPSTSIERVPPQNLDAEQSVLGSMLLDRDAIARVVELVRPEDFYRDAHRRIYETMVELFERGEPVDLITVTDRLRDKGQLDDVGGAAYVTGLLNTVPTAANVEYYARIVLQKSMLRQLIVAGTQIAHLGFEGENDVEILVDRAEKLVFSIANRRLIQEFLPIREILKESFERIDRRYQEKGTVTGVPTGFTDLDQLTSGLQPADLAIVAARPAMGKCLKFDAEIVDARTGEVSTIQEIVAREAAAVWTLDAAGRLQVTAPSQFVDDGIKPVYRVRTLSGREVETTLTHPFLTPAGWRPLAGLSVGEPIAVPSSLPVFGTTDLPAYEVKLLAYLCAETMPTSPALATDYADAVAVGEAIRAATRPATAPERAEPAGDAAPYPVRGAAVPEAVGALLTRYRTLARPADARAITALMFTLTRDKLALFLSRLLACTGLVEVVQHDEDGGAVDIAVRAASPSPRMARQVQHLLLRFGVSSAVAGTVLTVKGEQARRLFREIGLPGWERLRSWARFDQGQLLTQPDIVWDPVAAIDYSGDVQVYDLTILETHNFIANDVCVHNTTLSLNIAQHAAVAHQVPVAIFSLETSKEQLVQRFLCAEAEVDGSKLRTGFLSDSDWPKLARAMGRLSEAPVYIDDSANISVIEMRAKARKLKAEHGLGLIVVDYLQMIQSYKRTENRTQEISEIARSLKSLAKELEIPLIAVSQLSRAVEMTGTRRPMLSHLRECVAADTVVWDADTGRRWTVGQLAKRNAWPRLLSLNTHGRLVPVRPANVFEKGENVVFEVRTCTGRRLRATANHPVLTAQGWKKLADLTPGAQVAAARLQDPASVGLARAWPRSADSAGRHNQRLAFGGPPRTRPEVALGLVWRGAEADWRASSGLRHRGGPLPLRSPGGYPARPSTLRSAQALRQPPHDLDTSALEQATGDILWDLVVEIVPCGRDTVYDLVMPGTHNFVANGLVVHNSGELEQVADLVLFIYREDYYNPETEKKNIAEIMIAKHRNGPIGTVELFFHREHSRFANLERRRA